MTTLTSSASTSVATDNFQSWLRRYLPLLLLTLLAALLRFSCLSRPEIWGDEAATFHRVTSSYADLLAILRTDGFVPLHYELYWLLARRFTLTPTLLRLVPAIAGTLMVPAMYFLARQLVSRRTSLLVAAFTATSAWLMVFSHDAKMYMHFWLFVVLHVACLLWWMRSGKRIPFWCMVAAGCAMAGLHATGLIVLALDLILFLAHPRTTWRHSLPFTLALLLIAAGPAGYYLGFNRFSDTVQTNWNWSGIQWIEQRNQGHATPELIADTAASYLFAFNFVPESIFRGDLPSHTPRPILIAAWTTLATLLTLALLGALPWRTLSTQHSALTTLPTPLSIFYLATWLCIPTYIFYCASVLGFASPFAILPWYLWAGLAALLPAVLYRFPGTRPHAWRVLVPVVAPVLLCGVVYLAMRGRVPPGSIWMPRYIGIIFPAFAIIICALVIRLPRPLRVFAIALLLGVNVTQSLARLILPTEPPVSRVAADVWRARDPDASGTLTYAQVRAGFGPPGAGTITNLVGLYHLRLLSGQLVRPLEFRFTTADRIIPIRRFSDPALVAWDAEANPAVRTIIVWTEVDASAAGTQRRLLARLGPDWRLQSTDDYPVRVYWTWASVYTYRRQVYTRD